MRLFVGRESSFCESGPAVVLACILGISGRRSHSKVDTYVMVARDKGIYISPSGRYTIYT